MSSSRITGIDVQRALVRAQEVHAPVALQHAHTQNNRRCFVLQIGPNQRTIVGARETYDVITAITATTLALTTHTDNDLLDVAFAVGVVKTDLSAATVGRKFPVGRKFHVPLSSKEKRA